MPHPFMTAELARQRRATLDAEARNQRVVRQLHLRTLTSRSLQESGAVQSPTPPGAYSIVRLVAWRRRADDQGRVSGISASRQDRVSVQADPPGGIDGRQRARPADRRVAQARRRGRYQIPVRRNQDGRKSARAGGEPVWMVGPQPAPRRLAPAPSPPGPEPGPTRPTARTLARQVRTQMARAT